MKRTQRDVSYSSEKVKAADITPDKISPDLVNAILGPPQTIAWKPQVQFWIFEWRGSRLDTGSRGA